MKTTESTKTTEKNTPANETKVNAETKDKDTSVKISVKNLKKTFGKLQVLKDINIDIHEGEVVVVIGPSGSGKSTFLRCLNKLEQSNGGSIIVNGEDINDKKVNINKVRENVGMVFQHFNLFPNLSVMLLSFMFFDIENITKIIIKINKPIIIYSILTSIL